MNFRSILTFALLVMFSVSVSAQNDQQGRRRRMDATEMFNRNAERLVKQLKLDDEKKDLFTVLYLDYMAARQNAAHPKGESDADERVDFKKITDEEAKELVEKQFARTEAELKVDKEYYAKFLDIITPAQAAQVFLRGAGAAMGGFRGGRPEGMGRGGFGGGGFGGGFGGGGFGGPGGGF